jgi:RNA polymerase primary sigma factor
MVAPGGRSHNAAMEEKQSTARSAAAEDAFGLYLREIAREKLLTPAQEVELAARIKRGDKAARERMITANLRLVVKLATDYANLGLPLLDLVSEGNIGLMKAVERFDPEKGGKLSTYAAWWIKQSIKRALANQSKTIRVPVHQVEKIAKIRRLNERLTLELGRDPTDEELAEEVGLSAAQITALKSSGIQPTSLDAPVGKDDGDTLFGDMISDENAEDPLEQLEEKDARASLGGILKVLTPREREIMKLRYGLGGGRQKTLEDIGEKFGITRERIRQIQVGALKKLRKEMGRQEAVAVPD